MPTTTTAAVPLPRRAVAELVGTACLVFFGAGSAVFGFSAIGALGVAFTFGLVLLALAYSIGPVSGCHVNPAVTLGVLLSRGLTVTEAAAYWVAQLVGGIAGGALLYFFVHAGGVTDATGALGTNSWGKTVNGVGAFVVETVLTLFFVLVILLVTGRAAAPGFAGLAIGLALTVAHLVGIPLTGTSVNPARSIGPALFEGGTALTQLWLFIVAPLVGGLLAALLAAALRVRPPVTPPESIPATDPTGADVPSGDRAPAPRVAAGGDQQRR